MRNEINLSNEEYRAALMADVRSNLRVIIVTMGIFLFIAISHGMTSPGELMYLLGIPLIPSSFFIVALIKTLIRLHKNKQRENEKGSPIVLPAGLNEKRFIGVVTGSVFKKKINDFSKHDNDMTVEVYNQKGETLKVVALTNNGPYQKGERVVIVRRGSSWLILQYYVPGMIVEGLIRYDIDELNKKGINILNEKDSAPEIGNKTLSEDTDAKIRILDTVIRQAMAENDLVKDNIKISCIYILLSPVLFILTTRWTGFCLVGSLGLLWLGAASLWITIHVQNNATKHMEDAKKLKEETLANT